MSTDVEMFCGVVHGEPIPNIVDFISRLMLSQVGTHFALISISIVEIDLRL